MRKCKDCEWWRKFDESLELPVKYEGQCRKNAPTATGKPYHWPPTNSNMWCGESKPPHVHFDMVRAKMDMIKKEVKEQIEGKNG